MTEQDDNIQADPDLKAWDTPAFVEMPLENAATGFTNSGADNAVYS
jgi:hypothetical protein